MKSFGRYRQIILGLLLASSSCRRKPCRRNLGLRRANHATQLERMAQRRRDGPRSSSNTGKRSSATNACSIRVEQVTTLNGILTTIDEQTARNKALIGTISSVGQTIRTPIS